MPYTLDATTAYDACTDAADSAPVMSITNASPASTSVVFTVSITDVDNVGIKGAGVIIGSSANVTMDNPLFVANVNSTMPGIRSATVTGLTASTGYFVRTWIELNSGGDLIYSTASTVTTLA